MKNITVIGSMLTGNKGAASMMISLLQNLKEVGHGDCMINCLSIFAQRDERFNFYKNLKLIKCTPFDLICVAMPLSIFYFLFGWFLPFKKILINNKVLKTIYSSDLVVNIAGICYSDGRGPVLLYNVACDLMPIMMKKNIYKYSQAIGPFKNLFNRISARMILPQIAKISARGEDTAEYLKGLDLKNYELCPDGVFSMSVEKTYVTGEIKQTCEKLKYCKQLKIGVAPSSVLDKYCHRVKISYTKLMAEFIQNIVDADKFKVVLFPYSGIQNRKTKKNNDLLICKEIYGNISSKNDVIYLGKEYSAEDVNYLITHFDILVTARYHAMIIALLSGAVPLVIGWSHKYFETLKQFGIIDLCTNYSSLNVNQLEGKFLKVVNSRNLYREKIVSHLPGIKEKSFKNFIIIKELLESN